MKREYVPITVVVGLFAAAFFWSLWSETLYPLLKQGDTAGLVAHLVGVPVILVGLAIFVYGGFRTLRNMFDLVADEQFLAHAVIIHERPSPEAVRQARWANFRLWLAALARGSLWMGIGFLLLGVGGYIINY